MNKDKHDIENLLQANVEEQLSRLDWNRFEDKVAKRLATAELRPRRRRRLFGPLAVAAGFMLVVSILVAVVLRLGESPADSGSYVSVSFEGRSGGAGSATVVLSGRAVVRCEVTLLDSDMPQTPEPTSPSLCIVARRAEPSGQSGRRSSRTNIACLF